VRVDGGEKRVMERESGPRSEEPEKSLEVENSNNTHL